MQEKQDAKTIQLNLAKIQRNAAGDYHEYFIPSSIKLVLATTPQAELDEMAEDNGRMFRYRFGFPATRPVRRQVLEFQQTYDLSDREICWLKRAGHLQISSTGMTIDPSRLMPIVGWTQLAFVSLLFVAMIFLVAFSETQAWKQGLAQTILATLWFACAAVLFKLYVAPWNLLKRSGAIDSTRPVVGSAS